MFLRVDCNVYLKSVVVLPSYEGRVNYTLCRDDLTTYTEYLIGVIRIGTLKDLPLLQEMPSRADATSNVSIMNPFEEFVND